jgi:CubicO group peptidase (beta-lactamase class C family)
VKKSVLLAGWVILCLLVGCSRPAAPPAPTPTHGAGPAAEPSERVQAVERGLVPMTEDGDFRWGETVAIAERMVHYGVPGVSVAVINDYQIEWARGYGVLEAGGDQPVTPDTLFNAGSILKPVSAAAALTLVADGQLDLDGNVNDKLSSWQVPENEHTAEEKVTLRRLLSHSGGLTDGFTNRSATDPVPEYVTPAGEAPTVTIQQMLDAEPGVDVDGPTRVTMVPGTEFRYANADYAILELLVVDVTRKPYPQFMHDTVLGPLNMTSSTYQQPLPKELRVRATTEHYANGQPFEGKRHHYPIGGLWTTPSDLARFAIEIMLAYKGQSERVVSQETAKEMLRPQIDIPDNPLADFYGLGFDLAGEEQSLRFVHTGGTWGSTSLLWAYPETGQGAIIMTNSASGQGAIRFEILLRVAFEYDWPLSAGP